MLRHKQQGPHMGETTRNAISRASSTSADHVLIRTLAKPRKISAAALSQPPCTMPPSERYKVLVSRYIRSITVALILKPAASRQESPSTRPAPARWDDPGDPVLWAANPNGPSLSNPASFCRQIPGGLGGSSPEGTAEDSSACASSAAPCRGKYSATRMQASAHGGTAAGLLSTLLGGFLSSSALRASTALQAAVHI